MKIVTDEAAPVTQLRKSVPSNVAAAVAKALERLPADRFDSAKAFGEALQNPAFTTLTATAGGGGPVPVCGRPRVVVALAVTVVAALVAGWLIGRRRGDVGRVGRSDIVHAVLRLADSLTIPAIASMRLAISPSGRRIAFIGQKDGVTQLWGRELSDPAAHPIPDTENAVGPFFSPDGESVGFVAGTGARAALKAVAFGGGVVRTIVPDAVPDYGGASWGDDERIYVTHTMGGLARVPASGGEVTVIASPDSMTGGTEFDFPEVLPGSRHVLVMLWRGSIGASHVGVIDVADGRFTDLAPGAIGRYVAPGFLAIGAADGHVLVARFDLKRARLTSTPVPMLQGVQSEGANGSVQFAVSATGTIVYERQIGDHGGLVWVDRTGAETPVDSNTQGAFQSPSLSPDGAQIAVARTDAGASQIWVKQLATGAFSRLTSDVGSASRPVWAPDGRRVAYRATRNGVRSVFIRRADGSDSEHPAVPGNPRLDEIWLGPAGRYTVLRTEGTSPGTRHLLVFENGKDTLPRTLVESRFDHYSAMLSPDGRWLAYVSEESGIPQVYVRPFPNVDSARIPVSIGGGWEPVWSRSGTELFFRGPRGEVYTVPVTTGRTFTYGAPKLLFNVPGLQQDGYHRSYDVRPDGKAFLMVASSGDNATDLSVIFNWRTELERLKEVPK
jgi:serine/threonine-protein kinase